MIGNVIFDEYGNVVSAAPEYFEFIGAQNFNSLMSNIYEKDKNKVKDIFQTIGYGEKRYLIIRLLNYERRYEQVFMEIKLTDDSEDGDKRIYADIYTIENWINTIEDRNLSIYKYRVLLDILGKICFEYSFDTKKIKFYLINKNKDVEIYNGKFSEWKEYIISNNYIKDKNISVFQKLCKDIESGAQNFYYEINDSKVYADEEYSYNVFRGETLNFKDKALLVIGTLTAESESKEREIDKIGRDALTGLLSKESIVKYATTLINKKPDFFVNIVVIDVDNFKLINDNFGHLFGDEIIKAVSSTIEEIVNGRGVVGRFGGDEFVIVFSGFNDNMELRSYLRAIRMTIAEKFKGVKGEVDLSVSMGTAKYPTDGSSYEELFENADNCLYIAKKKGKNRYIIYDEVVSTANFEKKDKQNIGVIESREKLADVVCGIFDILLKKRKEGIEEVIGIFGKYRDLSRIVLFFGKELERVALWGDKRYVYDDAKYIYKGSYLTNFNSNGVFVIHSSASIEGKNSEVYSDFSAQRIYSAVQCLIRDDKGDVIGFISFEKSFQRKGWTENEIYNFTIISHLIGEILKKA